MKNKWKKCYNKTFSSSVDNMLTIVTVYTKPHVFLIETLHCYYYLEKPCYIRCMTFLLEYMVVLMHLLSSNCVLNASYCVFYETIKENIKEGVVYIFYSVQQG